MSAIKGAGFNLIGNMTIEISTLQILLSTFRGPHSKDKLNYKKYKIIM